MRPLGQLCEFELYLSKFPKLLDRLLKMLYNMYYNEETLTLANRRSFALTTPFRRRLVLRSALRRSLDRRKKAPLWARLSPTSLGEVDNAHILFYRLDAKD